MPCKFPRLSNHSRIGPWNRVESETAGKKKRPKKRSEGKYVGNRISENILRDLQYGYSIRIGLSSHCLFYLFVHISKTFRYHVLIPRLYFKKNGPMGTNLGKKKCDSCPEAGLAMSSKGSESIYSI